MLNHARKMKSGLINVHANREIELPSYLVGRIISCL